MTKEPPLDITGTYHLLLERKWTVVLSVTLAWCAVLLYNSRTPSIYRSTATLIIDKETTKSPITGQETNYETYLSESLTFNTHFELITSRQVLEKTVRALGLDREPGGFQTPRPETNPITGLISRYRRSVAALLNRRQPNLPEAGAEGETGSVQALRAMVAIENVEETRLLKIHASSPDPVWATRVANGLADAYIEFNIDNRLKSSQDTLNWLTNHLYEMKKNLEDAEAQFLDFKQEAKLISVEGRQQLIAQKITEFNDAYLQARNRRLELDSKLEQLKRIADSGKAIAHLRALIANDLINDLHGRMVQAEIELSRLAKVYKAKHPKMVQAQTDIEQIQIKLRQEIQKEMNNLIAERAVLMDKERVLQQTIDDFEAEGMEINKRDLEHAILSRNVQTNQSIYDALLTRLKEADITGNLYVSNIRVVERAVEPRHPVGPNKRRNLILAFFLGAAVGVGLAFLQEYQDRTLRTEDDVKKYLDLPVLAVIPIAEPERASAGKGPRRVSDPAVGERPTAT